MTSPQPSWFASPWLRAGVVGLPLLLSIAAAWWMGRNIHVVLGVGAFLFGLVATRWLWRKCLTRAPAKSERPMVSLVLLLKEPRYLEAAVLAEILQSAWDIPFSVATKDDDESRGRAWIVGSAPIFMANTGSEMFIVHNHEQLYFGEVEDLEARVPELRLRTILREHRAWLSVDAMGVDGEAETAAAYAKIARAIAELADDKVLGLFQPASNRLTPWEPSLEQRLRRGENLDELFAVKQSPVVQVKDDDPRMKAAVAEARRRWPEFVEAFQARKPGGNYAVKAPITRDGNTEFIWLEVVGLEPEYIHGKLANDPVNLGSLKFGDRVEVPLAELNDWTYCHAENDEPVGLFTVKILTQAFNEQTKRAQKSP